jgi:hypothetical protein
MNTQEDELNQAVEKLFENWETNPFFCQTCKAMTDEQTYYVSETFDQHFTRDPNFQVVLHPDTTENLLRSSELSRGALQRYNEKPLFAIERDSLQEKILSLKDSIQPSLIAIKDNDGIDYISWDEYTTNRMNCMHVQLDNGEMHIPWFTPRMNEPYKNIIAKSVYDYKDNFCDGRGIATFRNSPYYFPNFVPPFVTNDVTFGNWVRGNLKSFLNHPGNFHQDDLEFVSEMIKFLEY